MRKQHEDGNLMRISAKQWLYLPKMIFQEVVAKNFLELKTSIPSSKTQGNSSREIHT